MKRIDSKFTFYIIFHLKIDLKFIFIFKGLVHTEIKIL